MKSKIKNSKFKIIFMGTPRFGAIILEKLAKSNFRPLLAITVPDKPVGRKQILTPPPVKLVAEKYKIPIKQPEKIAREKSEIENLKPDLILVAAYGQILPKEILKIPQSGCLNIHPSLLPKYRGPSPIQSVLLKGEKRTGVTIILMKEKIDGGEIVAALPLRASISHLTSEELSKKLAELGAKLLIKTLPKWLKGEIKPKPQNESKATYTKIFKKEDGEIDWRKSPTEIERQIRAFYPWPGSYTLYQGKRLKILKAEVSKNKLIIKRVQLEGKKPMDFEEFLRGHRDFIKFFKKIKINACPY